MKLRNETLWEKLYNRLPANDAAKAARVLARSGCDGAVDYMSVKALSKLVETYRASTRAAIRNYRRWCVAESLCKFSAAVRAREGDLLRQYAMDQAALYLDTRRDYRDLVEIAMRPYRGESKSSRESAKAP
jgi:hypothetical protein